MGYDSIGYDFSHCVDNTSNESGGEDRNETKDSTFFVVMSSAFLLALAIGTIIIS
jgi:hypothetical protein